MNLIGIIGKAGSGKNTVAGMINKHTRFRYREISYAYQLKVVAAILLREPISKFDDRKFKESELGPEWGNMTVRDFLQRLGTDAIRNNLYYNTWVNVTFRDWTPDSNWIITDVRMLNEAAAIKERGGKLIKVVRPGIDSGSHQSETELDFIQPDYTIINDAGFFELELAVKTMLNYYANNPDTDSPRP